jgi:hypothetical protein
VGVIDEAESSGASATEDGSKAEKHDIFLKMNFLSHIYIFWK